MRVERVGTETSIVGVRDAIMCFLWVFFGGTLYFSNLLWKTRPMDLPGIRAEMRTAAINPESGRRVLDIFFQSCFFLLLKCDGVFDFCAVSVLKGRSTLTVCVSLCVYLLEVLL